MPTDGPVTSKGERTRARIVALAAPLFNTRGFAGTSMNDIIETTGLEKGGIYRHFASKDDLALAAFDNAWQRLRARYDDALHRPGSAYDRLLAFVETARASVRDPAVRGGCPLLNTATEADDTHPALRARASRAFRAWHAELADLAAQAVEAKALRADTDPEAVASVMIAAIEGAFMSASLLRDFAVMDRVAAHLTTWLTSLHRRSSRRAR
jgi:AcrR family transcriptional regulator